MRRAFFPLLAAVLFIAGCASHETRTMTVTAYCGCGECNGYTRGHWWLLKLDFWNRYVAQGNRAGEPYTGKTASGKRLKTWKPGLFSLNSLAKPWMIPPRLVFPWLWLPRDGTLAADTDYYAFGTRIYIPGYGWGTVQDRGSAIKGPDRIDAYMRWHWQTENWGRKSLEVGIER